MITSKAHKVRLGVFTLAVAALTAIVLIVFGGLRFWEHHDTYRIAVAETVFGLEQGAQVMVDGIRIGEVEKMTIAPHDLGVVYVTISVESGTPIHKDTRAILQYAGVTGLKVVDLRGGTLSSPRLPPGSTILQGETTLDRLEKRALDLAEQSVALMWRANRFAENLAALTDPEGIQSILDNARLATVRLASASGELDTIVRDNRETIGTTLGAVRHAASRTDDMITYVKGLLQSNESLVRSAMFDLRQASRNLKDMSKDVKQRPSRLLFSRPAPDRKLP